MSDATSQSERRDLVAFVAPLCSKTLRLATSQLPENSRPIGPGPTELRLNGVLRSSRRCKNVPAPGHSRIAEEVRVLRGGLALDALYLLARDVDRAGELVGLEHPAVDHILDLPRSEVQILGCLPQGDFLAGFVFHPTLTSLPGKDGSGPPQGYTGPAFPFALIHPSTWKVNSA